MTKNYFIYLSVFILLWIASGCSSNPNQNKTDEVPATKPAAADTTTPTPQKTKKDKRVPIQYPEILSREDFLLRKKMNQNANDRIPNFQPSNITEIESTIPEDTLETLREGTKKVP